MLLHAGWSRAKAFIYRVIQVAAIKLGSGHNDGGFTLVISSRNMKGSMGTRAKTGDSAARRRASACSPAR
jgi:hypothetical protein